MASLAESQHWLQHAILDSGDHIPGDPGSGRSVAMLSSSPGLTASQRLGIYRRGYRLRLFEAMRALHPGLRALLGPGLFDDFVAGYLDACPSRSYTLSELDRRFAGYLAIQRPDRARPPAQREAWIGVVTDMVRYERAFAQVYDGPGTEGPAPPRMPRPGRVMAMAPCLRALRLCAPVHSYYASVRNGQAPEPPECRPVRLVLSRRDYVVAATELPVAAHRFLSALLAGCPVPVAASRAQLQTADATGLLHGWAARGWIGSSQGNGNLTPPAQTPGDSHVDDSYASSQHARHLADRPG
jgi:Putative DNA-binding domain